jgi:fumarate hydratase, class II
MKPNKSVIQKHLDNSLMLVTALTPFLGYDKCSKISQYAHEHNLTLKEAAVKLEYITPEMFQSLVKPDDMVHPNH